MTARSLKAEPLTSASFSGFGDVIETHANTPSVVINHGNTLRFDDLATIDVSRNNGLPKISLFRTKAPELPILIKMMERHPLSSQAFYPLSNNPYLVVVAPMGDFNPKAIKAFIAQPDQGVNYRAGTWHHYSLALNGESDFLVVDRTGPGDNTDEVALHDRDYVEIQL